MDHVKELMAGDDIDLYLASADKLARKMHNLTNKKPKEENMCKEPHQTKREKWQSFNLDKKVALVFDVVVKKEKL